jgi:type I restriction enzyme M protein
VQTANKQLNFIQHVVALLKPGGRAAIVVPDNVLFESGAAAIVRRHLLQHCKLHTVLRLPTGLFYAQGVQANVIFFDKLATPKPSRNAGSLWVYDLRAGNHFSLKTRPLAASDLDDFVTLFGERAAKGGRRPESAGMRWRSFEIGDLLKDERANLDLAWSEDVQYDSTGGHDRLNAISEAIAADLRHAMDQIAQIVPMNR